MEQCLPPMWPRFDSLPVPYCIWVECVVGSRLARRVFFLWVLWFSSLPKTSVANSNLKRIEDTHKNQLDADFTSSINIVKNLLWKVKWSTWRKHGTKKKCQFSTRIEPMTSQTPGGRSIHCTIATRTHREQGHLTEFMCDRHPAYC